MANKPSARKRARQNIIRRNRNRSAQSRVRSQIKKFTQILEGEPNPEQVRDELSRSFSLVDKARQKGILHPNTAARRKSTLARMANRILEKTG